MERTLAQAAPHPVNSTTGRSTTAPLPLPARALFALARCLGARVFARTAARAFLTPARGRGWRRAHDAALAGAEPLQEQQDGLALRAWRFGCTGPTVLLVHGWGGHAGQLAPLAHAFAAAGCRAIAIDAPAHGASGGRIATALHFAAALRRFAERHDARAAVGHSLGGTAVALAVAAGAPLDCAVSIGAAASPWPFFRRFAGALQLDDDAARAVQREVERIVGRSMAEVDLARIRPAAPPPLLVVHDRSDHEVPFEDAAALADRWDGAKLLATDRLGHRRVLRDGAIAAAVVSFVTSHLPRCACGKLAGGALGSRTACSGCAFAESLWYA
jgi:pimeloyl-ACP methyl ester carboxylesterase